MADQEASGLHQQINHAGTFGNLSISAPVTITVKAAAAVGDVMKFIKLPTGAEPVDMVAMYDGAATGAGSTMDFGIKGVDGTTQDDEDYFAAGVDLTGVGVTRKSNGAATPVVLNDPHYVTGTVKGASPAADTEVTVQVIYRYRGLS